MGKWKTFPSYFEYSCCIWSSTFYSLVATACHLLTDARYLLISGLCFWLLLVTLSLLIIRYFFAPYFFYSFYSLVVTVLLVTFHFWLFTR